MAGAATIYASPGGDLVEEAAYREALARQVRQSASAGETMIFQVEVEEQSSSWRLTVPDIPGVEARARKRQEIEPAATTAIAAALAVPQRYFRVHLRFRA